MRIYVNKERKRDNMDTIKRKKNKERVSSIRPSFYGYHSELLIDLANKNNTTTHTLIVAMAEMLNRQDGNIPRELIDEIQKFRPSKGKSTNRRN